MKVAFVVVFIAFLALIMFGGAWLRPGSGATMVAPNLRVRGWDHSQLAYRQDQVSVKVGNNPAVNHSLTVIGPADVVLPPWLEIDWHNSIALVHLDGRQHKIADTTKTVWFAGGKWHESNAEITQIPRTANKPNLERTVFDVLIEHAPSQEATLLEIQRHYTGGGQK